MKSMPSGVHFRWFGPAACAVLLAGCTAYGPSRLAPGTLLADASRAMGPSTGDYVLPDGGRRLEFARGPMGRHTYMLDFDAQGRMTGWQQVLTEMRFNAVRVGTPSEDLLKTIGHPSERSVVGLQWQTVWSYRYESLFCQWFQVGLDAQGRVTDTGYHPDPLCDELNRSDL